MSADELVKKAKLGDREAIVELIMNKKNDYYRLALTYTGNQEDAMDALQDMIVIVHEKIRGLKKPEAFYSWSMTILVNCCHRLTRHRKLWLPMELNYYQAATEPDVEGSILINTAIAQLKPTWREAVTMKYILDMNYATIAQILGVPEGTAKSRVFNGLQELKKLIGRD